MAKDPVLPLYYNDITSSTQDWTDEEFGAFMRLLIYQWDKGSLPEGEARISRVSDSAKKNWPIISKKFEQTDSGLQNKRMEEIRNERIKFKEKQRQNVEKRYQKSTKNLPNDYQNNAKNLPLEEEKEVEIEKENKEEIEDKKYRPFGENDPAPEIDQSTFFIPQMLEVWKNHSPEYAADEDRDFKPISELVKFFVKQEGLKTSPYTDPEAAELIKISWGALAEFISKHNFFCNYSLYQVSNHIQSIIQSFNNGKSTSKMGGTDCDLLEAKRIIDQMSE